MRYVYILQSERNGKYYIGSTNDIRRRLKQHNSGMHLSSKRLAPFKLKLFQEYASDQEARQIETKLKKLKRRDYIKRILNDGIIKFRATSSSGRAIDS